MAHQVQRVASMCFHGPTTQLTLNMLFAVLQGTSLLKCSQTGLCSACAPALSVSLARLAKPLLLFADSFHVVKEVPLCLHSIIFAQYYQSVRHTVDLVLTF